MFSVIEAWTIVCVCVCVCLCACGGQTQRCVPPQELIAHLLRVDPEERYSAQDVLSHPWITANNSNPTVSHTA